MCILILVILLSSTFKYQKIIIKIVQIVSWLSRITSLKIKTFLIPLFLGISLIHINSIVTIYLITPYIINLIYLIIQKPTIMLIILIIKRIIFQVQSLEIMITKNISLVGIIEYFTNR